jgi:hypothetical protein
LTRTMTTVGLADTSTYTTIGLVSCLARTPGKSVVVPSKVRSCPEATQGWTV